MRFDEYFGAEYVFSTDQKVNFLFGDYSAEYYAQKDELLTKGVKPTHYVAKNLKLMLIISLVAFLAIIIIGSLRINNPSHALGLIQVAVVALVTGVFTLPGFTDAKKDYSFRVDNSKRCVLSVLSFLVAAVSIVMAITGTFEGYENTYFIIGIVFAALAFYNVALIFLLLTERVRLYRKTINNATCIGYVRRLVRKNHAEHNNSTLVCYMSPVFEYEVNGQKIAAIYDRLLKRSGSNIALNSEVTLHVDENDPSFVETPDKYRVIGNIVLAAIFAFLALLLFHGVLSGGVDGSSIAF